jgi:DNA-binding transcriptional LysR family regulator
MLTRETEGSINYQLASMFEITQLRCFVAVAEELHFGRAAVRLNMTQPPLSRQIQVLERIIDAPLLERTSRAVRLTPAGRSFLPEARRILKLAASATFTAKRIAAGKTGGIKIGFTAGAAYSFLPQLVTAMQRRIPELELSLKELVSIDQLEALGSGEIDVGLLRPPVVRPELDAIRVVAEPLVAAIPAGHALAGKPSLSMKDIDNQPFVMYAPYESRYFYDLLVGEFARANVLPRYVQQLSQIHSILSLVKAGLGIAVVPQAAASLRMEGIVLLPLRIKSPKPVELFLVWRRDGDNPLLTTVVDVGREVSES